MEPIASPVLRRLVERAARDGEVLAVILFGSRARGDAGPGSDIDVCLVLARLDELGGYLRELRSIVPERFEEYLGVEKKRACERLAQVAVEAALDVCALLVAGMRRGLSRVRKTICSRSSPAARRYPNRWPTRSGA